MKILDRIRGQLGLSKDQLIGGWFNGADDGSGLNAIWGYGLEFKSNGKGLYFHWGDDFDFDEEPQESDNDRETNKEEEFDWIRLGDNKIKIKFSKSADNHWEEIEYEISDFIGAYETEYFKIVKTGTEEFWSSSTPLYKSKGK